MKIIADNDNEDLLGAYLAGDPSKLSQSEIKKIAAIFGLPPQEVQNIVKGMTNARQEVRKQELGE